MSFDPNNEYKFGERHYINANFPLDYEFEKGEKGNFLFLHGYGQHFGVMKRFFSSIVPQGYGKLFINGPFPIGPSVNQPLENIKHSYAWYFFNPHTKKYFIKPNVPAALIKGLCTHLKIKDSMHIVGYSQGGYLAPFLGEEFKNSVVYALNSNIRTDLLRPIIDYKYIAINGAEDDVVDPTSATDSFQELITSGNQVVSHILPNSGHRIDQQMINQLKLCIEENIP